MENGSDRRADKSLRFMRDSSANAGQLFCSQCSWKFSPQRDIDSKEDVSRGVFTGALYLALFALLNANRYERTCLMTDGSSYRGEEC